MTWATEISLFSKLTVAVSLASDPPSALIRTFPSSRQRLLSK
jgi:hypothetical protein